MPPVEQAIAFLASWQLWLGLVMAKCHGLHLDRGLPELVTQICEM